MTWNRTAVLAALPVAAVAVIAGIVSFSHIEALGLRTGQTITDARLLPLAVDGLIVAGSVILLAGSWLGWIGVALGVAGTLYANVMSGAAPRAARCRRRGLARDRVHGGQLHARALAGSVRVAAGIRTCDGSGGRTRAVPAVPAPGYGLNGHGTEAERVFADEIEAGRRPEHPPYPRRAALRPAKRPRGTGAPGDAHPGRAQHPPYPRRDTPGRRSHQTEARPGCIAWTTPGPAHRNGGHHHVIRTDRPARRKRKGRTLRAVDAGTEVRLDEAKPRGPAYVDLTSGEAQRRPLIPEHWRTWENAKRHVSLAAARHGHRAAYHGLRSPAYFARALGFAVWGVVVTVKRLISWWHIPGTTRAGVGGRRERAAERAPAAAQAGQGDAQGARHDPGAVPGRAGRRRGRHGGVRAVVGVGARRGRAVRAFALAGRPQGKTITTKAELPAQVQPPDRDVIIRALGSLGIAEINQALATGEFAAIPVAGPRGRARLAGRGRPALWRHGQQVIDRRPQLASGLRRPLGAVWPEPVTNEHAGPPRAVGRPRRTSPRPSRRRGRCCAPGRPTCSSRSRSVSTRGSAASRCRWPTSTG